MEQHEHSIAVLAGLLHDVGKVWTRAEGAGAHAPVAAQALRSVPGLFPEAWCEQVWDAIESHHRQPTTQLGRAVRAADRLASGTVAELGRGDPATVPLRPTLARVDLGRPLPQRAWGYPLAPLARDGPRFPQPEDELTISSAQYVAVRDGLDEDLARLAVRGGVSDLTGVVGLISALRRWTTYVPAAAPGEDDEEFPPEPDVGLYDHLKLTGALAACLSGLPEEQLRALAEAQPDAWDQPVGWMLRADFSGIQAFIYRIAASRADGTFAGAARRLRGRSLYLTLLSEVVVDWFLRELDLPPTNILFNGGGRFDLLLPLGAGERLRELEAELHSWLLETFYGEFGIQLARAPVRPADFTDMREVYNALDDALALSKQRKFEPLVRGEVGSAADFHIPHDQRYHACNVCHLTPLPDTYTCTICRLHERLGQKLPATSHIAFLYGDDVDHLLDAGNEAVFRLDAPFRVTVALLDAQETTRLLGRLEPSPESATLYRLNDVDFIPPNAPPHVALGFRFLANEAPLDARGHTLDFDGIADKSQGAKLLGILKADVDRLGFTFGEGMTPALPRAATLSGALELYFGGRLDALCREVAQNAFYTVYAGGDDLFILGPWDRVVVLAQKLYEDFRSYACHNDNVTLSAGVLLVKPHFPIHRFAQLVEEELEKAKNTGRDRITVFTETVDWITGTEVGYDELLKFGQQMAEEVEAQRLHKGFVYFLKQLHDTHFEEEVAQTIEDPMWVPKFHYSVARRVPQEVVQKLELLHKIPTMIKHIQIPVSYVSLKTRKE